MPEDEVCGVVGCGNETIAVDEESEGSPAGAEAPRRLPTGPPLPRPLPAVSQEDEGRAGARPRDVAVIQAVFSSENGDDRLGVRQSTTLHRTGEASARLSIPRTSTGRETSLETLTRRTVPATPSSR